MSVQLDKFSSGSHSAKNAAGITRKDIINETSTNTRDKFSYSGMKPSSRLEMTDRAGKCLGIGTFSIDRNEYTSQYMRSTVMAVLLITPWRTSLALVTALMSGQRCASTCGSSLRRASLSRRIKESNAWNENQQNYLKKINETFAKENPSMFGDETMTPSKNKETYGTISILFRGQDRTGLTKMPRIRLRHARSRTICLPTLQPIFRSGCRRTEPIQPIC